ncbi:MAG: glycosyltransferase family 4 protein [Patescibacteria group bacterium]|nr:glycosyltransferase family 4 protein [Patescibacteria group bacterium]MDD5164176.1 glycosyltransferase family 4 protein [Patescibacteria group bacterium]MDD5534490.1 glycosyltransferase family 4 protein [Patescibacteria group bacterium]
MKICFLATADSIHSKKWIEYFAKQGHEVYWLSLGIGSNDIPEGIKFYLIRKSPLKLLRPLIYTLEIKNILNKIKPDIFHIHQVWMAGAIGALINFHPLVLTAWGSDILLAPKSKLKKPLIKLALKRADLITCDAWHIREAMIKLGANSSKIIKICFGIDTKKFSPGPKDENLISELKIQNCPIIISLRNFKPIYDIETLIKAIPLVLKEFSETKFIIAGEGSEENKIKNLAKDLKILNNIRFVGSIQNNELPKYLKTSDIYISTALSDAGISASTAEAMSCQLPVVITNTGENEKWIEEGKNGFLISIRNPEILAEKIINLLKDENKRKEFGILARQKIIEENDYYEEMSKMNNIYKKLIIK